MRIGVLGGTFDPIHIGHLILGEEARIQAGLDRVIFLPAGDPWRKAGRYISHRDHRLAMTALAISGNASFQISRCEIEREGPSYTIDTLSELRSELGPTVEISLIYGSDALEDLPHWREPERILAEAGLIVAERWGWTEQERPELHGTIESMGGRITKLDMPLVAISATRLRERIALGQSVRYLIPDAVLEYINKNNVYDALSTGITNLSTVD